MRAENKTVQAPITMDQLMRQLQIQGGNFIFEFDTPVYARVRTTVSAFPDGKTSETLLFDTAQPKQKIDLYFQASGFPLAVPPSRGTINNGREMRIRLSDCEETAGTRIVHYVDKFAYREYDGNGLFQYDPAVPPVPELGKEYILHWYAKTGDPYQAKATITFSATPFKK